MLNSSHQISEAPKNTTQPFGRRKAPKSQRLRQLIYASDHLSEHAMLLAQQSTKRREKNSQKDVDTLLQENLRKLARNFNKP